MPEDIFYRSYLFRRDLSDFIWPIPKKIASDLKQAGRGLDPAQDRPSDLERWQWR